MSLVHSSREQGDSGVSPAAEPLDDKLDNGVEPLSSLAEEVVPMRVHAARELDQMREERIRAVVGNRRRRLPRPSVNARVLAAGGVAVGLLAMAAALSLSSGGRSARHSTGAKPQRQAVARVKPLERPARQPQRLVEPHPRRRAAIRAKRKAARRHAQRERAHRAAHAEAAPSRSEAPATESQAPASSPPPTAATTESAPPPASSPPPSTDSNPAQEEFGFEH